MNKDYIPVCYFDVGFDNDIVGLANTVCRYSICCDHTHTQFLCKLSTGNFSTTPEEDHMWLKHRPLCPLH